VLLNKEAGRTVLHSHVDMHLIQSDCCDSSSMFIYSCR